MKTLNTASAKKLVARFDNELKNILMNDIKAIRSAKTQLMDALKQGLDNDTLSAA